VRGPEIAFLLEGSEYTSPRPMPGGVPPPGGPIAVSFAPAGSPLPEFANARPVAVTGRFRFGVPTAGRWSLRIRRAGFVPRFFPEVEVGDGLTDLGTLVFSKGATLEVRLIGGSVVTHGFMAVRATLRGEPSYTAFGMQIQQGDPPFVRVEGLGPGTFHVAVQRMYVKAAPLYEGDVVSDGETPLHVDVHVP
jgi:hypothetical protein